ELAVLVEGGVGEVLRAYEDLRAGGAVVGLDYLAVDVEAGGGAVVADPDPGPRQLGERAVVLAALVLPADLDVDAALGRLDERVLHGPVTHLLAVDAQAAGRAVDEGDQLVLRVGRRPHQVVPVAGMDGLLGEVGVEHGGDGGYVGPFGICHQEVPRGRVVPARQVGGHDDGLRPVDDHGLLVGVPVVGRGPGHRDPVGAEVGVRVRVHAPCPPVQDHAHPHAVPGRGRQVVLGRGVGGL